VFSEIIVVFSEPEARSTPEYLAQVLREMYEIKEFEVAFCLETLEDLMVPNLHYLRTAAAWGTLGFLPRPPLVFSRTVTWYDRFLRFHAGL
jgi:hypothetical protein